jgi:predicted MFS family arabinose efflux permease
MTYQSLWLQSVLGLSAIQAGLVVLPCSAAAFVASAAIGRVLHSASPRLLIGAGMLVIGAGALAEGFLSAQSSWPVEIPGLVLIGGGAGLAMAPLSATAMAAVPATRAGMAAGTLNTFRQLGYAMGIAVLGEVFRAGLAHSAGAALAGPLSDGAAQSVMARSSAAAHLARAGFARGLDETFFVAGGLGLVGGILVLVLVRRSSAQPDTPVAVAEQPESQGV